MKIISGAFICWVATATLAGAATNDLSATLQQGLFEEEANHDLSAAARAYQAVVSQFDKDRKLAATAVFRLGECYRKQGRTNEANAQYERVVREFADQAELAKLSRMYVSPAGPAQTTSIQSMAQQDAARAAAQSEDMEVRRIQSMLKDSPDLINAKDPKSGATLLQQAAEAGQLEVAKFLLANGADIAAMNPRFMGYSALHYAAAAGNKAMVEFLLSRGANVNASDDSGRTPLHLAVERGYRTLVEALVAHGADVNAKTKTRATALHVAAANGFSSIGQFLISHGAEVNAVAADIRPSTMADVYGGTPLHIAARRGDVGFAELLVTNKADVDATDQAGQTPLYLAADNRQTAVAALLLAHGANPNARDSIPNHGWTPLVAAVEHDQNEIVTLLLTNKADPNVRFDCQMGNELKRGWTPLLLAVARRNPEVIRSLLDAKADPNLRSEASDAAIFWALYSNDPIGRTNVLTLLLDHGAEVDARDARNQTPLIRACWDGDLATMQLLLAHRADPNASDNRGLTPLHYLANRFGSPNLASTQLLAMAQALITAGANVNALDKEGTTPLGELRPVHTLPQPVQQVRNEFAQLLREHGGVIDMPLPDRIQVRRAGTDYSKYIFAKGDKDWNRFTLLECLAVQYDLLTGDPGARNSYSRASQAWASEHQGLGFPDVTHIGLQKGTNVQTADLGPLLESGDCTKDQAVGWGEVINVPEADHTLNLAWPGFTAAEFLNLKKCLSREVQVVVKGKTTKLTLAPEFNINKEYVSTDNAQGAAIAVGTRDVVANIHAWVSFWLKPVLLNSGLVLTSSDLSRVKVTRRNETTGQGREWVVDCSESKPAPDFWLRDGDVIEVPEK